jgi:hypothetical protein
MYGTEPKARLIFIVVMRFVSARLLLGIESWRVVWTSRGWADRTSPHSIKQ